MFKTIKQYFCNHDYQYVNHEVAGVDAGWLLEKRKVYLFTDKCSKCDNIKKGIYFIYGDIQQEGYYDSTGWPIDDNGIRIKIIERNI